MNTDLDNVLYIRTPTLPHLLALLMRPPKSFPPEETSLLIIDSVSALFPSYFPNASDLKDRLAAGKITDKAQLQWLLNRKWNVASELGAHLARLAARGIAVLAVNQTHTKIKGQPRATLCPVVSGGAWETNVQNRIVLYRDLPDARFAEVVKRGGRTLPVRLPESIVSFRIARVCSSSGCSKAGCVLTFQDGLRQVDDNLGEPKSLALPEQTPSRKRKAEDEVADSQDEDGDSEGEYQWMDEALLDN